MFSLLYKNRTQDGDDDEEDDEEEPETNSSAMETLLHGLEHYFSPEIKMRHPSHQHHHHHHNHHDADKFPSIELNDLGINDFDISGSMTMLNTNSKPRVHTVPVGHDIPRGDEDWKDAVDEPYVEDDDDDDDNEEQNNIASIKSIVPVNGKLSAKSKPMKVAGKNTPSIVPVQGNPNVLFMDNGPPEM